MTIQTIHSPLPGTFYRRPAPSEEPFKNEGDRIEVGDVIGLIEVMKQFSDVQAEVAGELVKFHIEDGAAIEVGAPIADIKTE